MLQNTVIILIAKNISYSKNVHATIFYQMTEKKPIAKINRSDFLHWRFSSDDDFDFFDDSSDVIYALQRQDNYQVNYNIDDIFYNTGYLPCHLIQNWKDIYKELCFTEEEYDPDDNEIDPPSVHVEWTTETMEEE